MERAVGESSEDDVIPAAHPTPEHVVIVGSGGGSLTRFCCQRMPRTLVATIEIDEDVIALPELFDLPATSSRTRLIHADAADYFAANG